MQERISEIFEKVTDRFSEPINIGSRVFSYVFYRVEDIPIVDLREIGSILAEQLVNTTNGEIPNYFIHLPGCQTGLTQILAEELGAPDRPIEIIPYENVELGNGARARLNGASAILINDVITTAKTCLECHCQTTMLKARVLCWVSLIDRTFGPGPVPIVSAITGEPIMLAENWGS